MIYPTEVSSENGQESVSLSIFNLYGIGRKTIYQSKDQRMWARWSQMHQPNCSVAQNCDCLRERLWSIGVGWINESSADISRSLPFVCVQKTEFKRHVNLPRNSFWFRKIFGANGEQFSFSLCLRLFEDSMRCLQRNNTSCSFCCNL